MVGVCNRRWRQIPPDYVFSVEHPLVREYLEAHAYDWCALVCPREVLQELLMRGGAHHPRLIRGENHHECAHESGLSTGATALGWLLDQGFTRVYLVGFDGALDGRNLYTGTPSYHATRVSTPGTFTVWERRMVQMVLAARAKHPVEVLLGLDSRRRHNLEEVATKVSVAELVGRVERSCLISRSRP